MAKRLTKEKQIKFVLNNIKPLLQKNKIKDARLIISLGISGKDDIGLTDEDHIEILTWMYQNLGPATYFKDSNTIFPFEFNYYVGSTFIIPDTIQSIQQYAFANSNIRKITIPKSVRGIGIGAFSESSIREVTFENFSNVKFDSGVFVDSDLDTIFIEDNANKSSIEEFHLRCPSVTIVCARTGEVLVMGE